MDDVPGNEGGRQRGVKEPAERFSSHVYHSLQPPLRGFLMCFSRYVLLSVPLSVPLFLCLRLGILTTWRDPGGKSVGSSRLSG